MGLCGHLCSQPCRRGLFWGLALGLQAGLWYLKFLHDIPVLWALQLFLLKKKNTN